MNARETFIAALRIHEACVQNEACDQVPLVKVVAASRDRVIDRYDEGSHKAIQTIIKWMRSPDRVRFSAGTIANALEEKTTSVSGLMAWLDEEGRR